MKPLAIFCATLALYLRAGNRADASIKQAQAAGAWAVTKIAAVNTPTRDQLRDHARHLDRSLRSAAPVIPEP